VTAAARLAIALTVAAVVLLPGTDALRAAPVVEGTIVTVAGTGVDGHDGDGGPATAAAIDHPRGIAALPGGGFVFAEPFANTVRRVGPDGTITTIAGTGTAGFSGDGGPATHAEFRGVHGVGLLPDGGFVLADPGNERIRRIWPDSSITTVAGTGVPGFSGDGSSAVAARIDAPRGVAALTDGGFLIPDTENNRIRRVWPDGRITTVAGTGMAGFSGDGGPATAAELSKPFGVAPTGDGGFLVVDRGNQRIRRVSPSGTITTAAGTGAAGFSGDGGLATRADVNEPHGAAALPDGGFLIADTFNHRVRRVWPDATITTVTGTGVPGFSGEGGPAAAAQLNLPKALAVLADASGFLVGDSANNRVRLVRMNLRPPLELRVTTPRIRSKAGRPAAIRYTLSDAATTRLHVIRGGKIVLRALTHAVRGSNRLAFGRRLRPGSYGLELLAATPDGRSARSTASLKVAR
jgi:hypothetical protein